MDHGCVGWVEKGCGVEYGTVESAGVGWSTTNETLLQ